MKCIATPNLNIRLWKLDCHYQCFSRVLYEDVEFTKLPF